ncbi:hypothetical protein [Rhodococcus opacus]|uniref:hypothetical protein n=1 Tax=Rhodococcus opacus TaxID=37919 RepID=UPI002235A9D6|nr:hypothetical protein [Rhodococcus opacus]UZG59660.1 hypothetical protein ONE62_38480 [Rhodococcus opacus]
MHDEVVAPNRGGARPARIVARFQAALLALSVLSCAFVAVELASLRHWKSTEQIVPWIVLGVLVCSTLIVVFNRSRIAILQTRIVALCAAPAALFGVYEHVSANLDTGVLNHKYAWAELPGWEHLWLASTGAVGGTPATAPLVLALAGVLLGLATVGMAPDTARDDFAQNTGVDVARVRT